MTTAKAEREGVMLRSKPDIRFYPTAREQAAILNLAMEEHPGLDHREYNALMRGRILEWCMDEYAYPGAVPRDFRARMWLQAENDYPDSATNASYPESTWGSVLVGKYKDATKRPETLLCAVCHGSGRGGWPTGVTGCAHCHSTGRVPREEAL